MCTPIVADAPCFLSPAAGSAIEEGAVTPAATTGSCGAAAAAAAAEALAPVAAATATPKRPAAGAAAACAAARAPAVAALASPPGEEAGGAWDWDEGIRAAVLGAGAGGAAGLGKPASPSESCGVGSCQWTISWGRGCQGAGLELGGSDLSKRRLRVTGRARAEFECSSRIPPDWTARGRRARRSFDPKPLEARAWGSNKSHTAPAGPRARRPRPTQKGVKPEQSNLASGATQERWGRHQGTPNSSHL